jgi:tetratricopeptide (TPR) repeat protein
MLAIEQDAGGQQLPLMVRFRRWRARSRYARQALKLSRASNERGRQAWALRLLGEIAARHQPLNLEHAREYYQAALEIAQELGTGPLQAHCYLGLGTVDAKFDRREQADTELSVAIELYRAMEMKLWLPQAEAALASLRGGGS